MAGQNKTLGRFQLVGIPPAPRGIPQIEVTFDIDANGIVHVNAKDLGTGKEQSIKIVASQKLSDDELKRMQREAEEHAQEDQKFREKAEILNQADSTTYATEKMLVELKGKISDSDAQKIQKTNGELKELLGKEPKDTDAIKRKRDELNQIVQKASTELYKKAGKSGGAGADSSANADSDSKPKDDNVVDADYKVENEK